ncbi:helix-turn-helix domain-containing protein [Brytella acorum]|uniref:Uncharacterized protein n=1 Tax=Brytella acorum TaxID=2959299 RepID=A0AA35UVU9_9PROT|nr:hypothetical protein [Brytella acorum]MDF3623349.1 hypothetical protein [Brytella acorum]CAI9120428.1 hypothetical protein LMG32879_001260 [Brytella acorum]
MEEKSAINGIDLRLRHAISLLPQQQSDDAARWSLREFSKRAAIPYRTLQDYLSGSRLPGADALQKMGRMGIDINWVLLGEGEIPNDDESKNIVHIGSVDKKADDIIYNISSGFTDKMNLEYQEDAGIPLPFSILMLIFESFRRSMVALYIRASSEMPNSSRERINKKDMLDLMAIIMEPDMIKSCKKLITDSQDRIPRI